MTLITRTAIIQARVFPSVKEASERVLWRIGLNMSEAMELFLRRVIVDEKIPFEIAALNANQINFQPSQEGTETGSLRVTVVKQKRGGDGKKIQKVFPGGVRLDIFRRKIGAKSARSNGFCNECREEAGNMGSNVAFQMTNHHIHML